MRAPRGIISALAMQIPVAAVCVALTACMPSQAHADPLAQEVSLHAPYPSSHADAHEDRITVEYAVFELARQALVGYNFGDSRDNAGSLCGKEIEPDLRNIPLRTALERIIDPLGLAYTFAKGEIVLKRKPGVIPQDPLDRRVTLKPPYSGPSSEPKQQRITIQIAVMLLAKQAQVSYNWQESAKNTKPACTRWIRPLLEDIPLREALEKILTPAGLSYTLEAGRITLVAATGAALRQPLELPVSLHAPYPMRHKGDRADSIIIHHAVAELLQQAGLLYNLEASRQNAGPAGQKRIHPDIRKLPLKTALEKILNPVGLSYTIDRSALTLIRPGTDPHAEILKHTVSLTPPYPNGQYTISLQHAVAELARQAELGYAWRESREAAGPIVNNAIRPVIREQPLGKALESLLRPQRLRYKIENKALVLTRPAGRAARNRLQQRVSLTRPYPQRYRGGPTHKIRLGYAVAELTRQIGAEFARTESTNNVGSVFWRYVFPDIKNQPFHAAVNGLLEPSNLTYKLEGNKIVLYRK